MRAGVAPQTASGHLSKLLAAGLITMERHGRHHYHSLASSEIARMLEGMQQVASTQNVRHAGRTIRTGPRDAAMRIARGCYDHMAGHLGRQCYGCNDWPGTTLNSKAMVAA